VGITGVRLHDLRHYVATTLLSAGVDVRTVAGRLGHSNASTTLNVYGHFQPAADRAAAEISGRLLGGTLDQASGPRRHGAVCRSLSGDAEVPIDEGARASPPP
jgi:hypothetical protein